MTDQVKVNATIRFLPKDVDVTLDAKGVAQMFAHLSDDEQAEILYEMVEAMKPHRMQWDYISLHMQTNTKFDHTREVLHYLAHIGVE